VFRLVSLEHHDSEGPEEGQYLECTVKLLQSPTLRRVYFESVVFTNDLSQAVAKVLKERSQITDLHFDGCSFPRGGSTVIASALKSNTTLKFLHFFRGLTKSSMKSWQRLFYPIVRCRILNVGPRLAPVAAHRCHHCSWLYM
jgi:hypothetical protein